MEGTNDGRNKWKGQMMEGAIGRSNWKEQMEGADGRSRWKEQMWKEQMEGIDDGRNRLWKE